MNRHIMHLIQLHRPARCSESRIHEVYRAAVSSPTARVRAGFVVLFFYPARGNSLTCLQILLSPAAAVQLEKSRSGLKNSQADFLNFPSRMILMVLILAEV